MNYFRNDRNCDLVDLRHWMIGAVGAEEFFAVVAVEAFGAGVFQDLQHVRQGKGVRSCYATFLVTTQPKV